MTGLGYDELVTEAATVPMGSEGLVFLPYLTGERTPHLDPLATGAFVGLTARHTRAHLTRALMEGVLFSLQDGLEIMGDLGVHGSEIRASAAARPHRSGSSSRPMCTARPSSARDRGGAAYGAALLGHVTAGNVRGRGGGDLRGADARRAHRADPRSVAAAEETYGVYRGCTAPSETTCTG